MSVRIDDVARDAGVSMKTVSRVLNGEPNVREETRRRVEASVSRLGYRPNQFARSLAGQRSYVVALLYDNPSLNYLMDIQSGVLDACRPHGYNLLLVPIDGADPQRASEIDSMMGHAACDGVLLIPPLTDDPMVLDKLAAYDLPVSSISPKQREGRIGVMVDERAAVEALVERLLDLGHRRIGHITGHPEHGACEWRLDGYRAALERAGIGYDPDLVVPGLFDFESGLAGARRLLAVPEPPTAIFAANDDCAAGVMRVAAERGIKVPEQLSVCGFDDTQISQKLFPSLTTVRQPVREMGQAAMVELLKAIQRRESPGMICMDYSLQFRESIATAPRHA